MIQVRDVLQVKFGKIDQTVELFTQLPRTVSEAVVVGQHFEVLTDITGPMYSLVNTFVVEDISGLPRQVEGPFPNREYEQWYRQFQQFVEAGRREYYEVRGPIQTWSEPGMVVIRETYRVYKWQVSATVDLLSRYGKLLEFYGVGKNPRVLTDLSGAMFRAVIEVETDSLSAWESRRRATYREVEFQTWFNQMMTCVEAGAHEFYRVEYTR